MFLNIEIIMIKLLQRSLSLRLMILISLCIFLIIILISSINYQFLKKNFMNVYSSFFINEATLIENILKNPKTQKTALQQEIILEPESNHYRYFLQLQDEKNTSILATPDIEKIIAGKKISRDINKPTKIRTAKLIYMALEQTLQTPKHSYTLVSLYNVTYYENLLHKFKNRIITLNCIILCLSLLATLFLIKIGLWPLVKFATLLKKISPNTLEPLTLATTPREFQPLLDAINELILRIKLSHDSIAEFSSNIAHELRTPINNLMVSSEVFLNQHTLPHATHEAILSNLEEYQRLSRIIERLLFLSRMHASNTTLQLELINVYDEVKKVCDFHEAFALEHHLSIHISGDARLHADPTLFHHALSNILTNAIHYTDTGTRIDILITEEAEHIMITVMDEGPGIAKALLPYITQRFYRAEQSSDKTQGAGLGLAIVKSIMLAHQGHLHIIARAERGLKVSLIFPKKI